MNRRDLLGSVGAVSLLPVLPAVEPDPGLAGRPVLHVLLRLRPTCSGTGNRRWARILAGTVTGSICGVVRSGRLDWHVDPASGAAEAWLRCQVEYADGRIFHLRERSWQLAAAGQGVVRFSTGT